MAQKTIEKEFLTVAGLAALLGDMPVQQVYMLNTRGTGPRRYRVGNRVLYRRSDVDEWLKGCCVEPGQPART
jgi:predicted DNA-binding transcriptional regulator AlpA